MRPAAELPAYTNALHRKKKNCQPRALSAPGVPGPELVLIIEKMKITLNHRKFVLLDYKKQRNLFLDFNLKTKSNPFNSAQAELMQPIEGNEVFSKWSLAKTGKFPKN